MNATRGREGAPSDGDATWLLVIAFAIASASVGLTLGALGPILPTLHARLHTALSSLGLLFTANFLASLAATLVLGPLLDRRSARPLLTGAMLISAAGLLLLTLATGLAQALLAMLLMGLGGGIIAVGAPVLLARSSGPSGGRMLSLVNMTFGLGAFGGPLLAAAALDHLGDYRPVFVGIAALQSIPIPICALVPLPGPRAPAQGGLPRLTRRQGLAAFVLAATIFLYLGGEVGFGGWIFSFARQRDALDAATASYVPAAYWLALSAGSLGGALRPRRLAAEWLVWWCALGAALAALAMILVHGAPALVAGATAVGLFLGPIYPLIAASAAGLLPGAAARLSTLVIASSQVGGALLPWLQGLLLAASPAWGLAMTLAICLGMAALQLAFLAIQHAVRPRG